MIDGFRPLASRRRRRRGAGRSPQPNEYYFVTAVPANVKNFVERVHVYGLRLNSQGQEEEVCAIEWPDTGLSGRCGATKPTYFRIYVNPQKP